MICVDEIRQLNDDITADPKRKHVLKGCYLYSDNGKLDELHTFARSIGLTEKEYKTDNFLPRYVLTIEKRSRAISKGALQVLFRKTVEVSRKNKDKAASIIQKKRREKNEK